MPSVFPALLADETLTSWMWTPSQPNGVSVQNAESFKWTYDDVCGGGG